MTPEQYKARLAYVRDLTRETLGADDDASCLGVAILLWAGEGVGGFNWTAPCKPHDLELDSQAPES